jgi:photosystem II stability/assembly factor-like uncharacterized protein
MVGFGRFADGASVSKNGGFAFSQCSVGLDDPCVYGLAIAPDGTVFAATKNAGCYRAEAPGAPWTLVSAGFEEPSDLTEVHNTEALVSPKFAADGIAYIGAYEGLYVTQDGGESWRQCDVYSQQLNRHIVFSPAFATDRTVFCGNYGGGVLEYRRDEPVSGPGGANLGGAPGSAPPGTVMGAGSLGGATSAVQPHAPSMSASGWRGRSNNIVALFSDALAISPTFGADRTLFYGYSSLYRSVDAGLHWKKLVKPPGVGVVRRLAVSPGYASDATVLFGTGAQGTYRSLDGGNTWQELHGGLPGKISAASLAFSPEYATDRTIFVGTGKHGVFRSTDGGDHWQPASVGLTMPEVRALAISPDFAADTLVFAGTVGHGLFVSQDGGGTWTPSGNGLPESGPQIIEAIAISPDFAADGIVFTATLNDGVFRSDDGGASWQHASAGLPLDSVRMLEISPDFAHDGTLVAGTYGWTYETRDGGATWSRLPGGLRVDETHPTVHKSGRWGKIGSALNNGATTDIAATADAWAEFTFFGDSVRWLANRGNASGFAEVRMDDGAPVIVDLFAVHPEYQIEAFATEYHEAGWHTIRIAVTGLANPASLGTNVRSDGFFYTF